MLTKSCSPTANALQSRVRSARVTFTPRRLLVPFQLSTGTIEEITEASVEVIVETGHNRGWSRGVGAIYLSDLSAWPDPRISQPERDANLREVCQQIATQLPGLFGAEALHPLEIGLRLHHWTCGKLEAPLEPPALAMAMCASPF